MMPSGVDFSFFALDACAHLHTERQLVQAQTIMCAVKVVRRMRLPLAFVAEMQKLLLGHLLGLNVIG